MSLRKILFGFAAAAAMLFWAPGCYYDKTVLIEEEVVTGDVSFSKDVIPLFNAGCNISGCHNTGGTAPDLTADKAFNALTNGNYINVSAPESSELYQWLTGKRSLPMPLSGPDATLNATVLAWIKQGARNN